MNHLEDPCSVHPCAPCRYSGLAMSTYVRPPCDVASVPAAERDEAIPWGSLTLALSRRERERRVLCLQQLLEQRIGFYHVPVDEEGER